MQFKKYLLIVLLVIGFLSFTAPKIKACQCPPTPTVLGSFESSANVFIGEITGVEKANGNYYEGIKSVKVTVKKSFKGGLKEGETVFFEQGSGSDCQWQFKEKFVGAKLLIYDSDREFPSEWQSKGIWGCGRSGNSESSADLLYLENLDKVRGKTRIYGMLGFAYARETSQNRKIWIIGKDKKYETITDKNGFYEIYDLPAGEYSIEPEIPKGWRIEENFLRLILIPQSGKEFPNPENPTRFPVILKVQKDVEQNFFYVADNVIRGRVIAPSGKPMSGICLTAVRANAPSLDYSAGGCTDKQGEFEITGLDKDSYILVINRDGKVSPRQPVKTLFYPGVKNRSEATTISIAEGEKTTLKDFKVVEVLETLTLSGKWIYSDGTPVKRKEIEFIPDQKDENVIGDNYRSFSDYTEDDGSFVVKIFKGQTGKLRSAIGFGKKALDNCPQIKDAVVNDVDENSFVSEQFIEIKANQDLTDIKIIFPFTECKNPY